MASRTIPARNAGDGIDVRFRCRLRPRVEAHSMIVLTALVTLLLFVYLLAALLRPEWF